MEGHKDGSRIVLVSQKVKDIRVPPNGELEIRMGALRRWLHRHSFIPGDLVPATITPRSVTSDGILVADISGAFLSSDMFTIPGIQQQFPLRLTDQEGPAADLEAVFSSIPGVQIDDGGNLQNMIINLALAVLYARGHIGFAQRLVRISVASSSDPFLRMPEDIASRLRQICDIFPLDIPDRFSIQVPWIDEGHSGTLVLSSEPQRTDEPLERLIKENNEFAKLFNKATCFVSGNPIYDQLTRYARPGYTTVINASTAFRSLVATESYSRAVLLPMNNGEAADVCKLLLQRGLEVELQDIERPLFPSPLTTAGDIDHEALRQLDESIVMLTGYIPLHHPSFTCPITFGADGGLVIGVGHDTIATFTSAPSSDGDRLILGEFSAPNECRWDRQYESGAGDAVAAVVALFNTISPRVIVDTHLCGREPDDRRFCDLACTVFVGILGRIAGSFLLRTVKPYWANICEETFPHLLDEVAAASVAIARTMVKRLHAPVIGEVPGWGIRVIAWRPGSVAYPAQILG